jgi:ectoine hydroxylase-related dioxygenase (phytanoyl-CoA dioxygenase family)
MGHIRMCENEVKEKGFSIILDGLSSSEVAEFLSGLTAAPLPRSRAGIRHALRHRAVVNLANSQKLLSIARRILGEAAIPFRATIFDKSQNSNWLVVWHQDTALPLEERREVSGWGPWSVKDGVQYAHAPAAALSNILALRVHLDDSTGDNGPLRVLPGTHTQGVLTDDLIRQLATKNSSVDCTVPAGGILVMRPLLVHSSSKSVGSAPRRVLHIEYGSSLKVGDGLKLAIA